jgi:hypothetical protein
MFDKDLGMTLSVFSSALLFTDKYKTTTYIKSTLLLHISDNLIPSIIIDYHVRGEAIYQFYHSRDDIINVPND